MIYSVNVTNPKNESLLLELTNPWASGLYIRNIDGLGPPRATINMNELSTVDGGIFSSARMTERNIVMTLGMLEHPTVEDARLLTYKFFPLKKLIRLEVTTDRRKAEVYGYVETNEPVIFSEQEQTQISILCPDPLFYEVGGSETVFAGVSPEFEFPFSNESLTEPLLIFGEILTDTRAVLNYKGDADSGVTITIHAMGDATNITLYNIDTRERLAINTDKITDITGQAYGAGDDIIISTYRGSRGVQLLRNGAYTNIIGALDRNSDWFQLTAGDNIFSYTAETGEDNIIVTFNYRNAYGGV